MFLTTEFEFGDRRQVHFIRAISQSESARTRPRGGQTEITADAGTAMHLNRPVNDAKRHRRRNHFDHGYFRAGRFVADLIHHIGGFQRQ